MGGGACFTRPGGSGEAPPPGRLATRGAACRAPGLGSGRGAVASEGGGAGGGKADVSARAGELGAGLSAGVVRLGGRVLGDDEELLTPGVLSEAGGGGSETGEAAPASGGGGGSAAALVESPPLRLRPALVESGAGRAEAGAASGPRFSRRSAAAAPGPAMMVAPLAGAPGINEAGGGGRSTAGASSALDGAVADTGGSGSNSSSLCSINS
mmetsp:Transcript_7839/g.19769  ORF Transcript_7839/g.19769 Transcript_7839/m.19769 type:complete len:211 (-) Transcript_7839:1420-2052(-)